MFGITIKSRPTRIIAGAVFILIALILLVIAVAELLVGLTDSMPVTGYNGQINIHHFLSPIFFVEAVLILGGGIVLLNNGFKLILDKSPFRFFLRHSILSVCLLLIAILLVQGLLQLIWTAGSGGPDFKVLLFPLIFFLITFLLYFAWRKIFKKRVAKDYWALLPVFVIIVASFALTGILSSTHYHSDPEEAAKAFASPSVYQIKNSSSFLFAETEKGESHIASLNPGLLRSLRKYNVRFPNKDAFEQAPILLPGMKDPRANGIPSLDDIPQMPTPGWTPLLLLLLILIFYPLGRAVKNSWSYLALPQHIVLVFGLLNLYILYWFAIASAGSLEKIFFGIPKVSPYTAIPGMLLVSFICGITLVITVKNRLASSAPVTVKKGWTSFFYFMHLFTLASVSALSFKNNGNPVLPWLFCYVLLSAGTCLMALNSQKETL